MRLKTLLLSIFSVFSFASFAEQIVDISSHQLQQADKKDLLILDVRSPEEFAAGHVPHAINIPHTEIQQNIERLLGYKDKTVVVYCRSGYRAGKAGNILVENGFSEVQHLEGDMLGWEKSGNPIEK